MPSKRTSKSVKASPKSSDKRSSATRCSKARPKLSPKRQAVSTRTRRENTAGTKSTAATVPLLPLEILSSIIRELDPTAHRMTLISLTRVSKAIHAETVPVLYGELVIRGDQLFKLVTNGRDPKYAHLAFRTIKRLQRQGVSRLTASSQRAFQSIKRLRLLSAPSPSTTEALWLAASMNTPLFPNVKHLIIETTEDEYEKYALPDLPKLLPEESIVLFDEVDICVLGGSKSEEPLLYLPTLRPSSITAHHWNNDSSGVYPPLSVRFYPLSPLRVPFQRIFCQPHSYGFQGYDVHVYVRGGEVKECTDKSHRVKVPLPDSYINDSVPCVVCGKRWLGGKRALQEDNVPTS